MVRSPYVYILASKTRVLYIGVTSDLTTRMLQHKSKSIPGFTARYNVDRLVYRESFETMTGAIAREKQLKGWTRKKKIAIVSAAPHPLPDLLPVKNGEKEEAPASTPPSPRRYGERVRVRGSANVSRAPSLGGGALPGGVEQATRHAREVCEAARAIGTTVTVDAEDHTTTDQTLGIVEELRADFPELGVVLQAALHRTSLDAQRVGGPGSRIRLCKGAYAEPESVARQEPADVTTGFIEVMRQLFSSGTYVMIASHDPALIAAAQDVAADCGRGRDDFEFQMLYGIRSDEQRRLAAAGYRVRVYVPCGTDWWGYFLRRLAERPANLAFFLKALVGR